MDARALQSEADKIRINAASRQDQASKLRDNAAAHNRDGDTTRFEAEESQAAQLADDAQRLEEQAQDLERQALLQLDQVRQIEGEQNQLQADFDRRMKELEDKKKSLAGGPIGLF